MKTKLTIFLIVLLILSWLFFFFFKPKLTGNVVSEAPQIEEEFSEKGFVGKVIDGDTVIINGEIVRLLGMDTDERGYPCYQSAKKRLEELIIDKEVILEKDSEDKDQYERYLRYIFLDGKNINLQIVEEGLAVSRFSPKNQKYKTEILEAEQEARGAKRGCKWTDAEIIEEPEEEPEETDEEQEQEEQDEEDKQETEEDNGSSYDCSGNIYNCDDFSTHAQAQAVFDFCFPDHGDIHKLDRDGDGLACESLP